MSTNETKQYKLLHPCVVHGDRKERGEVVRLTEDQARAFDKNDIEPVVTEDAEVQPEVETGDGAENTAAATNEAGSEDTAAQVRKLRSKAEVIKVGTELGIEGLTEDLKLDELKDKVVAALEGNAGAAAATNEAAQ